MTLSMKDICVSNGFSSLLLEDISLDIEQGKTLALLGASGSGKTLSLSALQGIIPDNLTLTKGEILLDGMPIDPKNHRGKIFASIMQNPRTCFNPLFNIKSHIKETLDAIDKHYNKDSVRSILHEVGLDSSMLSKYSFELSGGMLQRVMIAIALLMDSKFILADELTSNQDYENEQRILSILDSIQANRNIGMLLVTHNLKIAAQHANKIIIIHSGKIQEIIKPSDFDLNELIKLLIDKLANLTR